MRKKVTVNELRNNRSFNRWVKGIGSVEEVEYWNQWMEKNPENREAAVNAIHEITGFAFHEISHPDIDKEWKRLQERISGQVVLEKGSSKREEGLSLKILKVAAVLLLASITAYAFVIHSNAGEKNTTLEQILEENVVKTASGELKTLRFSNGAKIVLNSNSTLSYFSNQENGSTIHVRLDGEAWFDAPMTNEHNSPAFHVYTPDGLIRDIGTQFIVTVNSTHSRVILQDGIVEVSEENDEGEESYFQVTSGELVVFTEGKELIREKVNPTFYSAWATQRLNFDHTEIRELAAYIEQNFNINVVVLQPEIETITLDGAVYFRGIQELVRAVSEVTDIPVYQSKARDTIYIGKLSQEYE